MWSNCRDDSKRRFRGWSGATLGQRRDDADPFRQKFGRESAKSEKWCDSKRRKDEGQASNSSKIHPSEKSPSVLSLLALVTSRETSETVLLVREARSLGSRNRQ